MDISNLQCLPIRFHDSHTTKVNFENYKLTLEFDYIVDESEKNPPNDKGLILSFVLNRKKYTSEAIDGAVELIISKNRTKTNLSDFVRSFSLADYVKFLNNSGERLDIHDIYVRQGGCLILAEQTVDGSLCGNWVVIQLFAVNEVNYEWKD